MRIPKTGPPTMGKLLPRQKEGNAIRVQTNTPLQLSFKIFFTLFPLAALNYALFYTFYRPFWERIQDLRTNREVLLHEDRPSQA